MQGTSGFIVKKPSTKKEWQALDEILMDAFNVPENVWVNFYDNIGKTNIRTIIAALPDKNKDNRKKAVAGGLAILPMGQWYKDTRVPLAGIVAVGVAPQYRSRGTAAHLMAETVKELHTSGYPIAALYPATQRLYRKVGFEQAGVRNIIRLPLGLIDSRYKELAIRLIDDEKDVKLVKELYRQKAICNNGNLDRPDYIWRRIRNHKGNKAKGYLVYDPENNDKPSGYLYYYRTESSDRPYSLFATDFVALTPQAGLRLLAFLADHKSMAGEVKWSGSVNESTLALLREQCYKIEMDMVWMLRIIDVSAAVKARKYPASLTTCISFEVYGDTVLPEVNNHNFTIKITEGKASVNRGKDANTQGVDNNNPVPIRIHINGMASLYTGFRTPAELMVAGLMTASNNNKSAAVTGDNGQIAAALATLETIFAGSAPWMPDMF